MELTEIITSTVSLFMAISFILIILSYTIFKIKDYSRIKAHARVNVQNSTLLTNDLSSNIKSHNSLSNRDSQNNQQLKNRDINNQRSQGRDKEIRKDFSRFNVLNETSNPRTAGPVKANMRPDNIFELYSQNEQERMHKLKLSISYK